MVERKTPHTHGAMTRAHPLSVPRRVFVALTRNRPAPRGQALPHIHWHLFFGPHAKKKHRTHFRGWQRWRSTKGGGRGAWPADRRSTAYPASGLAGKIYGVAVRAGGLCTHALGASDSGVLGLGHTRLVHDGARSNPSIHRTLRFIRMGTHYSNSTDPRTPLGLKGGKGNGEERRAHMWREELSHPPTHPPT